MNINKDVLSSFILHWNGRFKWDRIWRKKYNIPFGSDLHRNITQIEIYFDILEDQLFEKYLIERENKKIDAEEYKKGNFLKEQQSTEEEDDDLFNKINFNVK